MKNFFCVFTIILISSTPITSIGPKPPIDIIIPKPTGCNCIRDKVPLYRLYSPTTDDHFYTTSLPEATNAANTLGYQHEASPGWVFPPTANCLCNDAFVPVYRLYRPGKKDDHFYTTSVAEASNAAQNLQYKWEGIAYYCAAKPGDCGDCGSKLAFHRYYRNVEHFYTTSLDEGFTNVIPYGGTYEGILCYIWAN